MHYYRQQAVAALASAQLLTVHATFEKPESRVGLHAGFPADPNTLLSVGSSLVLIKHRAQQQQLRAAQYA
eukprot:2580-Heterococcus_DN1.PRE.4